MYEEFKSIENDLETLLIRIHNLHFQIHQYDKAYMINTKQLDVYLTRNETLRLLTISEDELDILVSFNFFSKKKLKKGALDRFLLRDVIWLRGQKPYSFSIDALTELIAKKKKEDSFKVKQ
ncbi:MULTISPECIES: hypothetical protein [Chitinophagaceae]